MYEYNTKGRQPLGLINLSRAQIFSQGLGAIQPSEAQLFSGMGAIQPSEAQLFDGMGAIQPSGAKVYRFGPGIVQRTRSQLVGSCDPSIEECCVGCQNSALSNVGVEERTGHSWLFWVGIGLGVGGALYLLTKSGIFENPRDVTDSEAAQQAAALAVQAGLPTILWGPPGIGKSSWLEALGEAMNAEVFTVIGSTKDPADIGGIMNLEGRTIPPMWAQKIRKRSDQRKRSVLFLDEFTSMSPLVHAALLRVVREKIAGELNFDPTDRYVSVVAAANAPEEGAGSMELPPPAANRLIHIKWVPPSVVEWGVGLLSSEWPKPQLPALPRDWKRTREAVSAEEDVAAFVAYQQRYMLELPATSAARGEAWPSPRSWEMAADALGAARVVNAPPQVIFKLVSGAVGMLPAKKFFDWLNDRDAVDGRDILAAPKKYEVQLGRPDVLYAAANAVVNEVKKSPSRDAWERAWEFMEHARAKSDRPEVLALAADRLMALTKDKRFVAAIKDAEIPEDEMLDEYRVEGVRVFGGLR
jgi:MoxR-like ATPase